MEHDLRKFLADMPCFVEAADAASPSAKTRLSHLTTSSSVWRGVRPGWLDGLQFHQIAAHPLVDHLRDAPGIAGVGKVEDQRFAAGLRREGGAEA